MLNLRELRYFVAVAETLHFGRAAARLHIAQPALSRSIKGLEAKLGVVLLERSSREVRLTPAGAELLIDAQNVLAAGNAMMHHARELTSDHQGELNVGFLAAIEDSAATLIERFAGQHPGVTVNHRREYQRPLLAGIRSRDIDLAIVMEDPEFDEDLVITHFVSPAMVGLVGPEHPLADRESASLAELARYPLSDFLSYPGLLPRVLAPNFEAEGIEPRWLAVGVPAGRGPSKGVPYDDEIVWLLSVELRQPQTSMRRLRIEPEVRCPFAIVGRRDSDGGISKLFQEMGTAMGEEVGG